MFLLLAMSMHTNLWWGMSCHPLLATGFIVAYYSVAVFCIFAGLTGAFLTRGMRLMQSI